jgi:hypothetical protein
VPGSVGGGGATPPDLLQKPAPGSADAHKGVITPSTTNDDKINKGVPSPQQYKMPVIRPPGTADTPPSISK